LSRKLICFEGKMNEYFNQSNFLHFLLLFPISSATGQSHDGKTRCLSRRFIHPFLDFFVTGNWYVSVSACCIDQKRCNSTVPNLESTLDSRGFPIQVVKVICFMLFATCDRVLSCNKMTLCLTNVGYG